MTPLYFDPAVGFSSMVAFSVLVPSAIRLYASRSSSRVASLATGRCVGGSSVWPFTPFLAAQPQEIARSEEHTSELQSQSNLVCRLLLEKKKRCPLSLHLYHPCGYTPVYLK